MVSYKVLNLNIFLVLLWNIQTMEICSKGLQNIKRWSSIFRRMTYGKYSSKLFGAWKHCTRPKSFIATWSQQIYSCITMALQNWEIWTCPKLQRKVCCIRRQGHLTTQVQRCGETSLTITNLTYGLLVVCFMNLLHLNHHLELKICRVCTKKY